MDPLGSGRHTTMKIKRGLAARPDDPERFNRRAGRYAGRYQQRGLVHVHVLVRLDRAMPDYRSDQVRPPARRFTVELLERAIRTAIEDVDAPVDDEHGGGRVRWGGMLDIAPLQTGDQRAQIAGYLAKYSTKSTERGTRRRRPSARARAQLHAHRLRAQRGGRRQAARADPPPAREPVPDVETDWQPAALAIRARRAMSNDEPIRLRLHDGAAHTGRVLTRTTRSLSTRARENDAESAARSAAASREGR